MERRSAGGERVEAPALTPERTEFGPYRIIGRVGAGGMGIVHRAVHRETGVEAALKTVRVIDPALLAGLRREVRALSRLRHPGIVRILDVGLGEPTPWYAMELLQGRTLRAWLRGDAVASNEVVTVAETSAGPESGPRAASPRQTPRRPPPPEARLEMLRVVAPLCDALAFLHGEGVVHLDVKPDNVFVVGDRPVLMDFGLAARAVAVQGREVLDVVGRGVGTAAYIAPEQLRGDVIDARADLYALGCMLYELITGETPFVADTPMAVVYSHLELPPAPPSERVDWVSPGLEALVLALLEKSPEKRPGYAADVAHQLRALVPGSPPPWDDPPPRAYLYRPQIVCREEPLAALRADLARATGGETRIVVVGGESGVGKTRLAAEIARNEIGGEFLVVTGECTSLGIDEAHGAPLAPLAGALDAIADRCLERGASETARLLGARAPLLVAFAPALRELPGADAWEEPEALPARAAGARLVRAAADTLVALARVQPLILIVDDLHWADDLTMQVLRTLASEASTLRTPLLVMGTYRSEETTPALVALRDTPGVTPIELGRLDATGARAMMDGMLGRADLPVAMVDSVSEHAEGNPFFIAEYLRAAVREQVLRRVEGRWNADDADGSRVAALPLPHSIRDLVNRRLRRLGPIARQVAEVAAVMGRDLEPDEIGRHVRASEPEVADALLELVATQMHEALPDGRLRFVHAKLHDSVYAGIAAARRSALHVAIADAIAATPPRPGRAALLAHHLIEGGAKGRALDALEAAGLESLGIGSYSGAGAMFERARTLADAAGIDVPVLRRARWERGLGDARFALGDLGQAAAHGRAALALLGHSLPATGAGAMLAVVRESTASALTRVATGEDAAALTEAALSALRVAEVGYYALDAVALLGGSVLAATLAGRAGAEVQAAKAYAMLGLVVGSMRLKGASESLCARAIRGAEAGHDKAAIAFTLYANAANAVGYCEFGRARVDAERASALARGIGDEYDAGVAETVLGHCEYWTGDLAASLVRFANLAETSRAVRATQHEAWGLYAQARTLVHTGECARAVVLCEEAKEKLVGQNDAASDLICEALLAWALLGTGDRKGAIAAATGASERIARSGAAIYANIPGYAATIEVWLAVARDAPRSLDHARRAQKVLRTLAMGTPLAESTAKLYAGRLALAEGSTRRAQSELAAAARLAQERGMRLDEGMARLALSDALDGEARVREEAEARAILTRVGANRHLKQG